MGVPDPMFLHDLAMELGMTVRQLTTGIPGCSAKELTVDWPLYLKYREQEQKDADKGGATGRAFPKTMGGGA